MIPQHIGRKAKNDNYRALALYAADAKINGETGEKTLMSWHEGCLAEDYHMGMIEVEATQAMNTRTKKEKTYHLMVSFRPEDEAKLTPEILKDIEKHLAKSIGFDAHQRHCGVHKNTDNLHMHIAYNMINPQTFNRYEPFRDFPKLHRACRELEQKYGLAIDPGMEEFTPGKDIKKPAKVATIEAQTGQQSFFSFVSGQKEQIIKILESSENWAEFHEGFLKIGLELKLSGNGFTIKDRFAENYARPSHIDRSLSKARMEKKLGSFIGVTASQAADIKSEKKYSAAPLHQNEQTDNLYAQFQAEMKQRKFALEAVKERESEAFKINKMKWDEKRKAIESYAMLPAHKRQLLQTIKVKEDAELLENRIALTEQRKAIRQSIPYTSWTKFLQHKAAQGNETALTVLQSKKIQPELCNQNSSDKFQASLEAAKKSKAQQAVILKTQGINQKHKRALISVLKMQELISKGIGTKNDEIKHRIDTKGTVIFTLKTGGTIRDTGAEIHFSAHDEAAHSLATKYAKAKWGRRVINDNNSLKLASQQKKKEMSR